MIDKIIPLYDSEALRPPCQIKDPDSPLVQLFLLVPLVPSLHEVPGRRERKRGGTSGGRNTNKVDTTL